MEVAGGEKLKAVGGRQFGESFVAQTPEKTSELSVNMGRGKVMEIPEKYVVLSELFDCMICSIRLLSLRKRSTTFQNIRIQVEILSGRDFQYKNLAQMKYVLPEVLKIKKVPVHDKKSFCIKTDININLVHDFVERDHEKSVYVALSELFTSRVKNFHRKHLEDTDIPEAELPEPFNEKTMPIEPDSPNMDFLMPNESDLANSSHISSPLRRQLSQKDVTEAKETTQHLLSNSSDPPLKVLNLTNRKTEDRISPSPCSKTDVRNSSKLENCSSDVYTSSSKSTPLKLGSKSESTELMLETPSQLTPKRSSSCQNKSKSVMNDGNIIGSLTAKRSLMFSHLEDGQNATDLINEQGIEQTAGIQDGLLEAEINEDPSKDGIVNIDDHSSTDSYKVCQHTSIDQQQNSTCLSNYVSVINQVFKSVGWRSITKEELVHKITINYCDIDENSDVDRQVELLEDLVPDWIHKKLSPSGDRLYSINKVADLSTIQERVSSYLNK